VGAVQFDVYLFLFVFFAYPVVAFTWKVVVSIMGSIPGLDTVAQGLAGVV
jgi:hypothetical protein